MKVITKATPSSPKVMIYGTAGCIDGEVDITFKSSLFTNPNATKRIKLKNLHKRINGDSYVGWRGDHSGEKISVRSLDEKTGKFCWSEIEDIYYSGEKETFQLKTSDKEVVATGEHLFWTKNGWVKLSDLKIGDEVGVVPYPMRTTSGKQGFRNKEILVKYHPTATHKIVNGCEYCRLLEHRFIYEAHLNGLTPEEYRDLLNNYDGRDLKVVSRGMEVHHKNGDHFDNRVENLELLSKSEHAKLGSGTSIENIEEAQKVVFEKVVSIAPYGMRHTYDIKCPDPNHSFVANKFVVHNTGKSTLASQFPSPLFLDLEGGLNYMDVARTPLLDTADKFYAAILALLKEQPKEYKTIVIDSLDWFVRKVSEKIAGVGYDENGNRTASLAELESTLSNNLMDANGGYGKAKEALENHIRSKLIPLLAKLNQLGYGIVLIAHAYTTTILDDDGTGMEKVLPKIDPPTIGKKPIAEPAFVEWVDNLFFLKKVGNDRIIQVEADSYAKAKNRLGLSGEYNLAEHDICELLKLTKGDK